MRIVDLLKSNSIDLNFNPSSKRDAIDKLVDLMDKTGNIKDKQTYKKAILDREALSTTGIGEGIAIPHGKSNAVTKATLVAAVSKQGVDYEALDDMPSHLFFMIAVPEGKNDTHLQLLARLSTILMDEQFKNSLINSKSQKEFLDLIDTKEKEKFSEELKGDGETMNDKQKYKILAVTACPTGIAHTYMAAEKLSTTAANKGISIKVETNGSEGAKNVLTSEEIKNADCIIVAADKKVEMARFEGKKVLQTKVANGINKADELISKAVSGDVPVYHHGGNGEAESSDEGGVAHSLYKQVMNGVSHMLPFVVGGGILIALAFLFDNYAINPKSFGSNTPFAAFLMNAGKSAFGFMLPVLAGYIAMSIGDRPALAVGFVGGLIARDGGSSFLGALFAGFVAGYIVVALKKICSKLPSSLEGIKPMLIYPVVGILAIVAVMVYAINPPVIAINAAINGFLTSMGAGSKILLGIVLAAMMAVDMGGPINKAAYVFGVAQLDAGNFGVMAAVMIGGMVPPLAIALATTFFRNKFNKKERDAGLTNYVMGLSFITEGAIPFAAQDPLRVLPSIIAGSAVAGALSMVFNCTLRAPHGGIFVVPVIGNPFGYLIALAVGSVVGALLLGMLKKPVNE